MGSRWWRPTARGRWRQAMAAFPRLGRVQPALMEALPSISPPRQRQLQLQRQRRPLDGARSQRHHAELQRLPERRPQPMSNRPSIPSCTHASHPELQSAGEGDPRKVKGAAPSRAVGVFGTLDVSYYVIKGASFSVNLSAEGTCDVSGLAAPPGRSDPQPGTVGECPRSPPARARTRPRDSRGLRRLVALLVGGRCSPGTLAGTRSRSGERVSVAQRSNGIMYSIKRAKGFLYTMTFRMRGPGRVPYVERGQGRTRRVAASAARRGLSVVELRMTVCASPGSDASRLQDSLRRSRRNNPLKNATRTRQGHRRRNRVFACGIAMGAA